MTVRRLYAPELPPSGGRITLGEGVSRHVRVLRLRPGDEVQLFDGKGSTASARIESTGDRVQCDAAPAAAASTDLVRLVLLLSIPKGSTLDDSVRMATELGVDEIALMQADRSVPRWHPERARARVDRLTRIAAEAAAQCERSDLPLVHLPRPSSEWIAALPSRARGIAFGARADAVLRLDEAPGEIWCAIGPEGGFSDAELGAFSDAGFAVASLGRWILRVDTAVASGLSLVRDRLRCQQAR